jgi:hypothetical protein
MRTSRKEERCPNGKSPSSNGAHYCVGIRTTAAAVGLLKCSGLREPFYALHPNAIVSESLAVDFSLTSFALMHRVSLGLLGTV